MKILITGASGMVARASVEHCRAAGDEVVGLTRSGLNIADREAVLSMIAEIRPDAVLNSAAYTNVDGAESDEKACYAANADGPENLAVGCRENGAVFLTISTDYVFDGAKEGFYVESDRPNPLGAYARSKYEGELRVAAAYPDAIIVRSGWIYGPGGTNFLSVMPVLLSEQKQLTVVSDSRGTPTYAFDLARRMRELVERKAAGIFHAVNTGSGTTYFGFAKTICGIKGYDIGGLKPVTDAELDRPAPRPAHSMLASEREREFDLEPMPEWTASLAKYLARILP